MIIQYFDNNFNRSAIEASLGADEEIVCDNATVIVDRHGNISWIDNNAPICIISDDT